MSFVKEMRFSNKVKRTKDEVVKAEDLRQKMRNEDSRMVKGMFKNLEVKGGDLTFTYKKYKEDSYQTYHFEDGQIYEIPLGVANHIKEMTKVKKHAYLVDKDGKKVSGIGSYDQRYEFIPTEFK